MRYPDEPPADRASVADLAGRADGAAAALARRVDSRAIFGRDREVVITHHGQEYRLRITRADKLLLTK
jgi:hemin uptake protein HemP